MLNTCLALAVWIAYFVPPITSDGFQPAIPSKSAHADATQVLIEIALSERASGDSPQRTLANPTLIVTPDVPFRFHSGGEVQPKLVGDALPIGTTVAGVVSAKANGKHRLALKISVAHQVDEANPFADVIQTSAVKIRAVVLPKSEQFFPLSKNKTCTIRLNAVSPAKPASAGGSGVKRASSDTQNIATKRDSK